MASDEWIQTAIGNWAPRFTANGVDPNDLDVLRGRIVRWADWCKEWSAVGAAHEAIGDEAVGAGRTLTAGRALARAAVYYQFAQFCFSEFPDQKDAAQARKVACHRRALPHLVPPGERLEVPYEGVTMPGNLRRPAGAARPPLVLILPGLESTKEEFTLFEDDFLARGMATFTYDGPGQGEVWPRMKMRHDHEGSVSAVLDALARRTDVDARAVGAVGVSMGGYFAMRAAGFEPRLRAAASLGGPYDLSFWESQSPLMRRNLMHAFGADTVDRARDVFARVTLSGVASRIRCPILVVHGRLDRICPPEHAERIVAEAGGEKRLAVFEDGNHVCNNIPYKYRPLVGDWVREKLAS
jgi:2,6-dihydroxypseudooxynicotine hydrolase